MASMDSLPDEILEQVLLYLKPADRLKCALVCRRWAQMLCGQRMLEDVRVVLDEMEHRTAMKILQSTERAYASLRIVNVTLDTMDEFNEDFWDRIGEGLLELQLDGCDLSAPVFFNILIYCETVRSLEIMGCSSLMMSECLLNPPTNVSIEEIQKSLCNVRHLSLKSTRYATDASFHFFLNLMPNLTSLNFAGCSYLQFHPGIFQRFHTTAIEFSPSVLTFQNVLACMMRCKGRFSSLDFSGTLINARAMTQLVELYNDCLFELRLDRCDQLTDKAFLLITNFRQLRLLSVSGTCQVTDAYLEAILEQTQQLEHLDLSSCFRLRDPACYAISKLQRLKFLSLYSCTGISNEALMSLQNILRLRHLDLSFTNVNAGVFRPLSALVHLRVLKLVNCKRVDDECLQLICNHFKQLEVLNLEYCLSITDVGASELCRLSGLRELTLTGAVEITDRSVDNGLGSSDMRSLKLGLASRLTDSALISIARHHRSLQLLDLSGCQQISDEGLRSLAERLFLLRTLNLNGCRLLTDDSLLALRSHCPGLHRLTVEHCSMSERGIGLFERESPSVDVTY